MVTEPMYLGYKILKIEKNNYTLKVLDVRCNLETWLILITFSILKDHCLHRNGWGDYIISHRVEPGPHSCSIQDQKGKKKK